MCQNIDSKTLEYLELLGISILEDDISYGLINKKCTILKHKLKIQNNKIMYARIDDAQNYLLNLDNNVFWSNMDNATQILSNIYLGSARFASSLEQLKHYGITHILSIASEYPIKYQQSQFVSMNAGIPDILEIEEFITNEWVNNCYKFIEQCMAYGGIILIHCQYGKTRSAIIAVYYLAKSENISILEAYEKIKQKRDIFIPIEILQMLDNFI